VTSVLARLRRLPPGPVLIGLSVLGVLLGLRQKLPCNNGHPKPDVGWTHVCYSDVLALYGGRGLGNGSWPYVQNTTVEYPVLIGLSMALIGLPIHALAVRGSLDGIAHALGFATVDQGVIFFWETAVVHGLLVVGTTAMLLRLRRDRPGDVLLWAVGPSVLLAFTVNWDMLAVAPAIGALLAWSRGRVVLAGVLIGVGTAAKLFPVLFLLPLVVLCLRHRTVAARLVAARLVGAAAVTWLVLNLPVALANRAGWWTPYRFSTERWIDWGTLYYLTDHLTPPLGWHDAVWPFIGSVPHLNRTSLVVFLLACAGITALILLAPRPPRVAAMAFLVVAAFLLTNKVWSQQFVLWLVPLAVLARPRRTGLAVWQAVEVAYLFAFLRVVIAGKDDYVLVQTALARYLAIAVLAALVVAEALRPERDPVRGADLADPDAGPLAPWPPPPRPSAEPEPEPEVAADAAGSVRPEVVPGDADLGEHLAQQG